MPFCQLPWVEMTTYRFLIVTKKVKDCLFRHSSAGMREFYYCWTPAFAGGDNRGEFYEPMIF